MYNDQRLTVALKGVATPAEKPQPPIGDLKDVFVFRKKCTSNVLSRSLGPPDFKVSFKMGSHPFRKTSIHQLASSKSRKCLLAC